MSNISVVIPTFKSPQYLDLCLKSLIDGQWPNSEDKLPEIIVVCDGYLNVNEHILAKYDKICKKLNQSFIIIDTHNNVGIAKGTNWGVSFANEENVLIVNDDNIFPPNWNVDLLEYGKMNWKMIIPNQIEPNPSIFSDFVYQDFGKTSEDFNYEKYVEYIKSQEYEQIYSTKENSVATLPIYIQKKLYMMVGGWDEGYPGPHVVDWDFFTKLELVGVKFIRDFTIPFYHFGGKSTKNTDYNFKEADKNYFNKLEEQSYLYFCSKWGFAPTIKEKNRITPIGSMKGINYLYQSTETYSH